MSSTAAKFLASASLTNVDLQCISNPVFDTTVPTTLIGALEIFINECMYDEIVEWNGVKRT
jgi:hypothetical protein